MAGARYLVHDVDAAVRFYCDALGFELITQYGPAMAIVRRDGLDLWLAGPPSSAAKPMPDGRRPEPGGWNRIVIETDDIAGLVKRLSAQGVTFRNAITEGPGGKQVLAEDPSGNPIELFQAG